VDAPAARGIERTHRAPQAPPAARPPLDPDTPAGGAAARSRSLPQAKAPAPPSAGANPLRLSFLAPLGEAEAAREGREGEAAGAWRLGVSLSSASLSLSLFSLSLLAGVPPARSRAFGTLSGPESRGPAVSVAGGRGEPRP
jgi:hypothetical protein